MILSQKKTIGFHCAAQAPGMLYKWPVPGSQVAWFRNSSQSFPCWCVRLLEVDVASNNLHTYDPLCCKICIVLMVRHITRPQAYLAGASLIFASCKVSTFNHEIFETSSFSTVSADMAWSGPLWVVVGSPHRAPIFCLIQTASVIASRRMLGLLALTWCCSSPFSPKRNYSKASRCPLFLNANISKSKSDRSVS